jgi:hypothetical protein
MNTHRKCSAALTSVMAMILAVPGAAWADADNDHGQGVGKGGNKSNTHYNIHYNIHNNSHYDGHDASKGPYPYHPGQYSKAPYHPGNYAKGPYYPHYYPHYYPQPYPAPPCNNCGNHNHNNHNHDNDKLWFGLLGGGILGYGLSSYLHSNAADQGNTPTAISAPPPPTQYATTAPANPCLQQREYSTKIMVGGKQVDGYGMACLQPDGSWRYGAAQPESY